MNLYIKDKQTFLNEFDLKEIKFADLEKIYNYLVFCDNHLPNSLEVKFIINVRCNTNKNNFIMHSTKKSFYKIIDTNNSQLQKILDNNFDKDTIYDLYLYACKETLTMLFNDITKEFLQNTTPYFNNVFIFNNILYILCGVCYSDKNKKDILKYLKEDYTALPFFETINFETLNIFDKEVYKHIRKVN